MIHKDLGFAGKCATFAVDLAHSCKRLRDSLEDKFQRFFGDIVMPNATLFFRRVSATMNYKDRKRVASLYKKDVYSLIRGNRTSFFIPISIRLLECIRHLRADFSAR